MIETYLPKQLQIKEFRYIRIGYDNPKSISDEKSPKDDDWTNSANYEYDNQIITEWVNSGRNIGLFCGPGRICVVDCDNEYAKEKSKSLVRTLKIRTPSKNGFHYIYRLKESDTGIKYYKHSGGEVRISNSFVVAPGSKISTGLYEIVDDVPIAEISIDEIKKLFPKASEDFNAQNMEFTLSDESRSAREFGEVIRLIKQGKTKEEIFNYMMMFAKWADADPRYREHTYKNAIKKVEEEVKDVETKIYKTKTEEDIRKEFCDFMYGKFKRIHEATELIAKYTESKLKIYTTQNDLKSEKYVYISMGEKEGLTIPNGDAIIKEFIRKLLGIYFNDTILNQIMSKIEADTYVEYNTFFNTKYVGLFPVKNGILNIFTKQIIPFNSEYIFFKKADMEFNPLCKAEKYKQFLLDLGIGQDGVDFIFELMATALSDTNKMKMMGIFNGEEDNGKSTVLKSFKILFGPEFCTSIPLQMLKQDTFILDKLRNAKFNLAGDIPATDMKEIGTIKSITGGDSVTIQRKFLPNIDTELNVQHIFSCNQLPFIPAADKAFYNRVALVDFPLRFVTKTEYEKTEDKSKLRIADKGILDKILSDSEKSGILNEIIVAYDRLSKNGEFTKLRTSEEVKQIWIRRSNSFMAFCLDHIEFNPDGQILKKDLRQKYTQYCKKHRVVPKSDVIIKNTLTTEYGAMENRDSSYLYFWDGISFKNIDILEKLEQPLGDIKNVK